MPSWLLLSLSIAALTLVVPLFVLATTQSWRAAAKAWAQFSVTLLALAALGIATAISYLIWPPRP